MSAGSIRTHALKLLNAFCRKYNINSAITLLTQMAVLV